MRRIGGGYGALLFGFLFIGLTGGLTGCDSSHSSSSASVSSGKTGSPTPTVAPSPSASSGRNIYAADGPNMVSPTVKGDPYRIYVPNSDESSVSVIDPASMKVVDTYTTGLTPQHIVPSWDLKTLYATNNGANSLTPIDPVSGKPMGPNISVNDPYNMYFTPDGQHAIVVAEAQQNLDFRDPHTFALQHRLHVDCAGVDHIDFAADNSYLIATCEFSGKLVKVTLPDQKISGYLLLKNNAMPQDIKLDAAGNVFYVADMANNGLWEVDGNSFANIGFLPTGPEAHGLYPSRDAKVLYVSNRGGQESGGDKGSVSVVDFATRKVIANWPIAAPSTPDMGGVSPDGKVLWLSGRRNSEVYAIDTADGHLIARIPVGKGPHGLCVWPQPGNYSLGHTGILR